MDAEGIRGEILVDNEAKGVGVELDSRETLLNIEVEGGIE